MWYNDLDRLYHCDIMNVPLRIIIAGFAIFSMIFGSSNIVFPLIIGKDFSSNWTMANLGWCLATVLIPMVGYYGAMIFDADNKKYLRPLHKHIVSGLMLLLMLMFLGVVSRGINVSFGGIHIVSDRVPELIFNIAFCAITTILAWHPGKIVQLLGVIFTPLKFGGILIIVVGAIYFADSSIPQSTVSKSTALSEGFKWGYQTMDLLAAFIASASIYHYIKGILPKYQENNKKLLLKYCGWVCFVGGLVLTIVYSGLTFVGAKYSTLLQNVADEALFTKIAEAAMGSYASWFVAIVIAVCCLATNVMLSSVLTDYIYKDIASERLNRRLVLIAVEILTLVISFLGFSTICSYMAIILEKLYPVLIIFVIAKISYYYLKRREN